ncbi:hypothetical protein QYF61_021109 [Mycteria americana]|uniref:Uncharacterized protein n=1 Tax=Mycteria americana TaxID=33587 RepID=A0AAN7RZR8_MYCAM|nr:hypothetical protein QYF61_021109 [Mycteria americana]
MVLHQVLQEVHILLFQSPSHFHLLSGRKQTATLGSTITAEKNSENHVPGILMFMSMLNEHVSHYYLTAYSDKLSLDKGFAELFMDKEVATSGWRLNHFPGQPVPMLDNPFSEEKFPNIQSKPPLAQLEAISSRPITCYLGEETDPHLATTSFQAKQPQFPQPLLISLVLQTLPQLRCPSLDTLQPLNVSLVVRGPKLNTVFEALMF